MPAGGVEGEPEVEVSEVGPEVASVVAAGRAGGETRSFLDNRRIIRRSDLAIAWPVGNTTATVWPCSFWMMTVC